MLEGARVERFARWMARDGKRIRPVFAEWWRILGHLSVDEIADSLVSDTPMARRLRQSSSFAGLVAPRGPQRGKAATKGRRH